MAGDDNGFITSNSEAMNISLIVCSFVEGMGLDAT